MRGSCTHRSDSSPLQQQDMRQPPPPPNRPHSCFPWLNATACDRAHPVQALHVAKLASPPGWILSGHCSPTLSGAASNCTHPVAGPQQATYLQCCIVSTSQKKRLVRNGNPERTMLSRYTYCLASSQTGMRRWVTNTAWLQARRQVWGPTNLNQQQVIVWLKTKTSTARNTTRTTSGGAFCSIM